jgi:hypothetical protein
VRIYNNYSLICILEKHSLISQYTALLSRAVWVITENPNYSLIIKINVNRVIWFNTYSFFDKFRAKHFQIRLWMMINILVIWWNTIIENEIYVMNEPRCASLLTWWYKYIVIFCSITQSWFDYIFVPTRGITQSIHIYHRWSDFR